VQHRVVHIERDQAAFDRAKLFAQAGVVTLTSFITPREDLRALAREIVGPTDFLEVYVAASFAACAERDPKGLYAKAQGLDEPGRELAGSDLRVLHECPKHLDVVGYAEDDAFLQGVIHQIEGAASIGGVGNDLEQERVVVRSDDITLPEARVDADIRRNGVAQQRARRGEETPIAILCIHAGLHRMTVDAHVFLRDGHVLPGRYPYLKLDEVESGRLRRAMLDGIDEYHDTACAAGLDYVTHDYRHLWRAKQDQRHWGRRAVDRTRHFTRPGSFTKFIVGHSAPEGHYE
jgi:hypothetical protein